MQLTNDNSPKLERMASDKSWAQLWDSLGQNPSQMSYCIDSSLEAKRNLREQEEASLPPGSLDGMTSLYPTDFFDQATIRKLIALCLRCLDQPRLDDLQDFYKHVRSLLLYPAADFIRRELSCHCADVVKLEKLAMQLVCWAPDTAAVKFGLILLSLSRDEFSYKMARLFAYNDEYTLFSIEVLKNDEENFCDHLWQVAPKVHGWGRIHIVKNLLRCEQARRPDISEWLLTEGYRNHVFPPLLIPPILQRVSLIDILDDCDQRIFDKITAFLLCALEAKHSELFAKAGWVSKDLKQAYRLTSLTKSRTPETKRVLDWLRTF